MSFQIGNCILIAFNLHNEVQFANNDNKIQFNQQIQEYVSDKKKCYVISFLLVICRFKYH